jgi:hypothetical protein
MTSEQQYTTQLQAGLGMIEETRLLFLLWEPDLNTSTLYKKALFSGFFPKVSARRLRNIVAECFSPRYMHADNYPIAILKKLEPDLSTTEFSQLLFLFTARANLILADFVKSVYWPLYSNGQDSINVDEARKFVMDANQHGKSVKNWSDNTVKRVSAYLIGCCLDFGLVEKGHNNNRKILSYRILPKTAILLAYDLHFSGLGDNATIAHPDWQLFGLQKEDVKDELKHPSLNRFFIVQTAGDLTRIGWTYKNWEELLHAIN